MSDEDAHGLIKNHYLFGKLSDGEIAKLLSCSRIEWYRAGQEIFPKGAPGQSMMGVLSGRVRISALSLEGQEIVLNIVARGEIFGEIALLDGGDRTADATALTDCRLLVVYRRDLMPLLADHADICLLLLETICRRLRQTSQQVEDVLFADLGLRLVKALLRLAKSRRSPGEQLAGEEIVQITQKELGSVVGGTRESVNRHLQAWQKVGLIKLAKGSILIRDLRSLERLL